MIAFDFAYYRPDTVQQATCIFGQTAAEGKAPLYYGGGTEIISMGRLDQLHTGAVIDIKGIPECAMLGVFGDQLVLGAAVTLTQIQESNLFPLLGAAGGRVADHTVRDKITLGGNIAGRIIYREALLPLLLVDAQCAIAGPEGMRHACIHQVFDRSLHLAQGEFLVQVLVDLSYLDIPYVHLKKTRLGIVNYPIVTVTALKRGPETRLALAGVCEFPFRSPEMEACLNSADGTMDSRMDKALERLPAPVLGDVEASAEYRESVLRSTLSEALQRLEGVA
jgi:CO/xanthine dehydrogenase FAD-binding subunit